MASVKLVGLTKQQANAIAIAFESDYALEDAINKVLEEHGLESIASTDIVYDETEDPNNEVTLEIDPIVDELNNIGTEEDNT